MWYNDEKFCNERLCARNDRSKTAWRHADAYSGLYRAGNQNARICAFRSVGLKSTSTVHGHLIRLEKKGLLHRDAMKPRAMGLSFSSLSPAENVTLREIPVIGRVAAGTPILAEENVEETLTLPEDIVGHGDVFILRVRGESMIQAGIMNDDYIVVHKQPDANNGEIVVALIEDEATVKRFYKENGHIRLQPENDTMEPIIVPTVTILGKVVSLIRKF